MTRKEIRMDELAREYVETHDPDIIEELNRLSRQLQELEKYFRYLHIMREPADNKASRLPKVRHLWMRRPRLRKTGFVASHHAKGYDCRRAGNEIRWL
jgi:hypothetical protein